MIREAYESAATLFAGLAGQITPDQWTQPGLDDWTVRELVGHMARSLLVIEPYLATPTPRVELERPVDYYLSPALQTLLADPNLLARVRQTMTPAFLENPVGVVREAKARVLELLRRTPDDALLGTPAGGMRLIDYLPTRIFELVVHSLDLGKALSLPVALPEDAAALTLQLVTSLALKSGKAPALLLAATGRGPLPSGYSVI